MHDTLLIFSHLGVLWKRIPARNAAVIAASTARAIAEYPGGRSLARAVVGGPSPTPKETE